MNNITFVTSLYDIGRDKLKNGFSRSFDHYLNCFKELLSLKINLVVFCDTDVETFILNCNSNANVKIINKPIETFNTFPFFDKIQKIRTNNKWKTISDWLIHSPQSELKLYNPLVMSKQFFLNDASIYNFFNTDYFIWIDAGLSNTVQLKQYINESLQNKLIQQLDKMLYIAFPYDGNVEVHGFEKKAFNKFCNTNTTYVVRGGFFGGSKDIINKINDIYYTLLDQTLNEGAMGTEECIFTIISYLYPELCNIKFIEKNGLIYKFFEDLKIGKYENEDEIALYVLTYNLPKQFELWIKSIKEAHPIFFKKVKKYVINNSDDPKSDTEYSKLIKEYNFQEFKFNNIGINDGRYFAATHFNKSNHTYMIFFEDDMLLHNKPSTKTKNGLHTYFDNVFDTSISILNKEKLHFLKLSFDEFYGDNRHNWAYYNVPKNEKFDLFPNDDKNTIINKIDSMLGIPYAIGKFHYCNWPILFNKEGNKKVFLDTDFSHKFEQTWMSYVYKRQFNNEIKSGCLLGSIINHSRIYHYDKSLRKENKN